ncbi:hypothetical protein PsAD46_01340 [Pseudovibrio sp. Ad46]|nr:hypothetical protein PsAD46_01340 [Pseudovibrio sp. Ad46]KZK98912.1 hypothetical protein PsAD5_01535 [Pseudovibrio sp. Ad5]
MPSPSASVLTTELNSSSLRVACVRLRSDPLSERVSDVRRVLPSALSTVVSLTLRSKVPSPSSSVCVTLCRPSSLTLTVLWLRKEPSALRVSCTVALLPSVFSTVILVTVTSIDKSPSRSLATLVVRPLALVVVSVCPSAVPSLA